MTQLVATKVDLPKDNGSQKSVHLFDEPSRWAIQAALAANRPLLVRGEPGVGKSQLAQAAAVGLKRPFLSTVVDIRTESQDLLWTFDAVQRLAQAQISAAMKVKNPGEWLAESKFIHPGKLWWAFDWEGAKTQAELVGDGVPDSPEGWKPADGCVLLIDEIDKAESDVPNGLLEALGARSFPVRGRCEPVTMTGQPPLVVITTNEDRVLPNAFIRRCLVLHLELPAEDAALRDFLVARGEAHERELDRAFLTEAADRLIAERNAAKAKHVRPLPGQAEYLDLIRAVASICDADKRKKLKPGDVLARIKDFVLMKNVGAPA